MVNRWIRGLALLFVLSYSGARLLASPLAEPEVIPLGPNFLIRDNTGRDVVAGKPAVAFDGTNFLLGWSHDRNSAGQAKNVYAARISPTGTVLDPAGIAVSVQLNQEAGPPSVVFDGGQYLMVWAAARENIYELWAARVLPDGTVLDPGGVMLTSGGDPKQYRKIGLAFDGAESLVVWRTSANNLRGARISSSSGIRNLDDPNGFPIASLGAHYYPSVATDGNVFLVTWHDGRTNPYDDLNIFGARVMQDGTVLDPNGFAICDETGNQDQQTVGFNGQTFWVVWYDQRPNNNAIHGSAFGARVSAGGVVLDKPAVQIAERARGQMPPQINCQGTQCVFVWDVEYQNIGENFRLTDAYARRLTPDGRVLDAQAIPVSTAVGHQFGPVLGYGAGRFLVAWNDSTGMRNYGGAIWGQILAERSEQPGGTPGLSSLEPASPTPMAAVPSPTAGEPVWTAEYAPVSGGYAGDGIAFDAGSSQAFGHMQRLFLQNGSWQSEAIIARVWASWAERPDDLWVAGWCGGVQHSDGTAWAWGGCTLFSSQHIVTGLWGASPGQLWATGDAGRMAKHESAQPPDRWQDITPVTPFDLSDIWGNTATDIYAVGERGTILHHDGTNSTLAPDVPTLQTLNAIWGAGPQDIFAVGDWGIILHFDGRRWSQQPSNSTQHLFDVWGFSGKDVYAAGLSGTILHFDGTSWTPEVTGSTQDLLSVWGVLDLATQSEVVWASGNGNTILRKSVVVPVLNIANASVTEGDSGITNVTFALTLSEATADDITVDYATAPGTAIAPGDFSATSGTLIITAGNTSGTIVVPVVGDRIRENNETFYLNLTSSTNAVVPNAQGVGTIIDDDSTIPKLSINNVTAAEGNAGTTPFNFTVTLSAASGSTVTVKYATANGTAVARSDYQATSGTLAFAPGDLTKTVTVNVNGDTVRERNEGFTVRLSAPTNATIYVGTGRGTITNDD